MKQSGICFLIRLLLICEQVYGGFQCQNEQRIPLHFHQIGEQFVFISERRELEARNDIQNFCLQAGGHRLLNLQKTSWFDLEQLTQYMDDLDVRKGVIGLQNTNGISCRDEECNGQLFWDNGEPFILETKGNMEIRAKSYQECFNLEKGGQIESETCDNIDNGAFLCEFICPDSWILQAESCGNVPIPPKFSKVGNHFYQYLRERRLTWSRAESECISETGGNLPILKTKEDVDSLTEVIQFLEGEKQGLFHFC
ncbi:uncharacterized protein LOC131891413 [Tigriopus californicus]|uniref:uncharacterized protein LOC131891413 n=1 Tax=Tigriopus californicus TaxID=6832 RepID=UPI0027DA5D46|nr:uncharacterized protein LOC131891413 [Tigriopus californicus]